MEYSIGNLTALINGGGVVALVVIVYRLLAGHLGRMEKLEEGRQKRDDAVLSQLVRLETLLADPAEKPHRERARTPPRGVPRFRAPQDTDEDK